MCRPGRGGGGGQRACGQDHRHRKQGQDGHRAAEGLKQAGVCVCLMCAHTSWSVFVCVCVCILMCT